MDRGPFNPAQCRSPPRSGWHLSGRSLNGNLSDWSRRARRFPSTFETLCRQCSLLLKNTACWHLLATQARERLSNSSRGRVEALKKNTDKRCLDCSWLKTGGQGWGGISRAFTYIVLWDGNDEMRRWNKKYPDRCTMYWPVKVTSTRREQELLLLMLSSGGKYDSILTIYWQFISYIYIIYLIF